MILKLLLSMPNVWLGIIDLKRVKQKINSSSMALKKWLDWCVPEDEKKRSSLKTRTLFY